MREIPNRVHAANLWYNSIIVHFLPDFYFRHDRTVIKANDKYGNELFSFWLIATKKYLSSLFIFTDEQKPISWEDPLPRSNSISNANAFNPQSVTRKSNNSIISFPQRHNSYNLNSVNNNQETSFYNPQNIFNFNSVLNNNHLNNCNNNNNNNLRENSNSSDSTSPSVNDHSNTVTSSSSINTQIQQLQPLESQQQPQIQQNHLLIQKTHRKLEHTPSARSNVSSEDSWCPSEDHDADDISSYNDDDDNLSDRSTSLISTRTNQLRLTFNKAKQHLSLDKWRNNSSSSIMPSSTHNNSHNQESPGEPMSRLTRWWSMRRGSHQYDLSNPNSPNRSGSIEKDVDDKTATNGKKMPLLQEVCVDYFVIYKCFDSYLTCLQLLFDLLLILYIQLEAWW